MDITKRTLWVIFFACIILSFARAEKYAPVWTKTYSGNSNKDDEACNVVIYDNNKIFVVGYENIRDSFSTSNQRWLRIYDTNGEESTGINSINPNDWVNDVAVDSAGNLHSVGYEYEKSVGRKIWINKYNLLGSTSIWSKYYNKGTTNNNGLGVALDGSGNVYITGYETFLGQGLNIWTRKYDKDGNEKWTQTYNDGDDWTDVGNDIAVDSAGNVYVAGYETTIGQAQNIWIRKYDTDGNEKWTSTHNGNTDLNDVANGVTVDGSGNVYVAGSEYSFGQGSNVWAAKYDTDGNLKWIRTHNGEIDGNDEGKGIALDNAGNVYVAGYETVEGQGKNAWIRKYDNDGNIIWTQTYNGSANGNDAANGIAIDGSGNMYVAGYETFDGRETDIWVRKYSKVYEPEEIKGYFKIIGGKNGYINPLKGESANFVYMGTSSGEVKFKVFNLRGEPVKILTAWAIGPSQFDGVNYDCKNESGQILSSGVYIVQADGPGISIMKKLAIVK